MRMTIKSKGMKQIMKKLAQDQQAARKTLKETSNDLRRRVPGKVADDVRTVYNIKKADIMPAKKNAPRRAGKVSIQGETISELQIKYTGRPLSPARFGMTPKVPKTKGKKIRKRTPIKATIKKGQKKALDPHAFLATTGAYSSEKIQYIPFVRRGKKRYPINPVRTVSVPQMVSNDSVSELIKKDVNKLLEERLRHNVRRFFDA